MSVGFVLGNGKSRLSVDPSVLKKYGKVYACNAAYRDFNPDFLIAVDTKMINELIDQNQHNNPNFQIWANRNPSNNFEGINYFEESLGWSSGPTALWLASSHKHTSIFILGFDFYGDSNNTTFNNVYADTKNYKKTTDSATYCGNWIRQTMRVIQSNPEITYYKVGNFNGIPPELMSLRNLIHVEYHTFKLKIY